MVVAQFGVYCRIQREVLQNTSPCAPLDTTIMNCEVVNIENVNKIVGLYDN